MTATVAFRSLALAAVVLVSGALAGCNNEAKKQIDSSMNMRKLVTAILAYRDAKNAWPDSLAQIQDTPEYATIIKNPLTGDNPGYQYVKPEKPASTGSFVVLYQLRGGQRDTKLDVAYDDGSIRPIGAP